MASSIAEDIINTSIEVDGIRLISYKLKNMDMEALRSLGDEIKNGIDSE